MRYGDRFPPSWPMSIVWAGLVMVLALDVGRLDGFPPEVWTFGYGFVAVMLLIWRRWLRPILLVITIGVFFVLTFARAASFAMFQPHRIAGIAINVMLMLGSLDYLRAHMYTVRRPT